MRKVSKKNQTLESIAAEQEATYALANKKSQHFMPGSFVLWQEARWEVVGSIGEVMTIRGEDGSIRTIMPYALANRRYV